VFALTALNLERAVFDLMSGVDPNRGTSADTVYAFLFLLSFFSLYVAPILALFYLGTIGFLHGGSSRAEGLSDEDRTDNPTTTITP